MLKKFFLKNFIISLLIFSLAISSALAEVASSTNYQLENAEFIFGGGLSSSTNFQSQDSLGGSGDASSSSESFKASLGFARQNYPGVPASPTFTNTGGVMYNTLDFIIATGGNSSDTQYAIAISDDNFITSNFIQTDDRIGAGAVWQTYVNWGGASGERLVELKYNTTYKIKVKARYGQDSETGYSLIATASTINPTLSVTISGVNSGASVAGQTTNVATTATSVAFSTLQSGSIKIGAQQIIVSTNANAGYAVSLQQDNDLAKTNDTTIPAVSASNAAPEAWPLGVTIGRFGYHTTDANLCTGVTNRFSANNTFAAATSTPLEVACNTGPASNETTNLVFKVEVGSLQAAGDYSNNIIYIATATY